MACLRWKYLALTYKLKHLRSIGTRTSRIVICFHVAFFVLLYQYQAPLILLGACEATAALALELSSQAKRQQPACWTT